MRMFQSTLTESWPHLKSSNCLISSNTQVLCRIFWLYPMLLKSSRFFFKTQYLNNPQCPFFNIFRKHNYYFVLWKVSHPKFYWKTTLWYSLWVSRKFRIDSEEFGIKIFQLCFGAIFYSNKSEDISISLFPFHYAWVVQNLQIY